MNDSVRATDQIRKLENSITLAGKLISLTPVKSGTNSNGVPYISFNGTIQCSEERNFLRSFHVYVKSKNSDGSDSKGYAAMKAWSNSAVTQQMIDKDPTYADKTADMVELVGTIVDSPYVKADGKLIEATQPFIRFINKFETYKAEINLEGLIAKITDEVKTEDGEETPTGRQNLELISMDSYHNVIDVKNIKIPKEYTKLMQAKGYDTGVTARFCINLVLGEANKPAQTGIGVTRVNGYQTIEWLMIGADLPIDMDSERALDPKVVKAAMRERAAKLAEIKSAGYRGSKTVSDTTAKAATVEEASRAGIGKTNPTSGPILEEDDDDMPF